MTSQFFSRHNLANFVNFVHVTIENQKSKNDQKLTPGVQKTQFSEKLRQKITLYVSTSEFIKKKLNKNVQLNLVHFQKMFFKLFLFK